MLWLLGVLALGFVIRMMWKAYVHPATVAGRQAAYMNWVVSGHINNPDGTLDTTFARGPLTARVSFEDGTVSLVSPPSTERFPDFVSLERWLASSESKPVNPEDAYIEEVDAFISKMDKDDLVLVAEASDIEFLAESHRFKHEGFEVGRDAVVTGALLMEAALRHSRSRAIGLAFLRVKDAG